MFREYSCVINAVIYAVALNLILHLIAKRFATKEEIKPSKGAQNLSFKSQIMHMLVHHEQVPVTSSIIIAVIVAASITLGYNFKIIQ